MTPDREVPRPVVQDPPAPMNTRAPDPVRHVPRKPCNCTKRAPAHRVVREEKPIP